MPEENHYYPFGLTLTEPGAGAKENPYKYSGKELEKSFGIESYDFGARRHDPQTGRWNGIDELSEKFYSISPYVYCTNNPINIIDKDGRDTFNFNSENTYSDQTKDMVVYPTSKPTHTLKDGQVYFEDSPEALSLQETLFIWLPLLGRQIYW
ncbi:MAG: hypothetical protein KL787_04200 [Taibaiella sp.]|nr:hypothetical protein [Taibaiella sp.]